MRTIRTTYSRSLTLLLLLFGLAGLGVAAPVDEGSECPSALVLGTVNPAWLSWRQPMAMVPFNSDDQQRDDDPYAVLNLYVADAGDHTIKWLQQGWRGAPMHMRELAGERDQPGYQDSDESDRSKAARFNAPEGITRDLNGTVYVADTGNGVIRRIYSTGFVATLFRGPDAETRFQRPRSVAFGMLDGKRKLAVADEAADAVHILDLDEGRATLSLTFNQPTRVDWWGKQDEIRPGVWGSLIVADAEGIHWVRTMEEDNAIVRKIADTTTNSLFIAEQGHLYFTTPQNTIEWYALDGGSYTYMGPLTWCGAAVQSPLAIGLYFGWFMLADLNGEGARLYVLDVNTPEGRDRLTDGKVPNSTCSRCGPTGRPPSSR